MSNIDEHSRPSQACGASGCRNGGATAIEVAQQSVQRRRAASGARVNGTLIGSNLEDRAAALSLMLPSADRSMALLFVVTGELKCGALLATGDRPEPIESALRSSVIDG